MGDKRRAGYVINTYKEDGDLGRKVLYVLQVYGRGGYAKDVMIAAWTPGDRNPKVERFLSPTPDRKAYDRELERITNGKKARTKMASTKMLNSYTGDMEVDLHKLDRMVRLVSMIQQGTAKHYKYKPFIEDKFDAAFTLLEQPRPTFRNVDPKILSDIKSAMRDVGAKGFLTIGSTLGVTADIENQGVIQDLLLSQKRNHEKAKVREAAARIAEYEADATVGMF